MADEEITAQEIAEALVCLAKLIVLARKVFPGDVEGLLSLEDDLTDLLQEQR